jgi:hypothetical protein
MILLIWRRLSAKGAMTETITIVFAWFSISNGDHHRLSGHQDAFNQGLMALVKRVPIVQ